MTRRCCLSVGTIMLVFLMTEVVFACGGSDRFRSSGRSFNGAKLAGVPLGSNFVSPVAMQSMRMNMACQAAIAQTNAYNARMRPIRIARAKEVRERKIAEREARKEIRIARLEAKKKQQQEFLAKARTWTDSTGQHTLVAILADANQWGVKLRKEDGSHVNVPHQRLSSSDRAWVAYETERAERDDQWMLAGL